MYLREPGGSAGDENTETKRRRFLQGLGGLGALGLVSKLTGVAKGQEERGQEVQELRFVGYPPSNKTIHDTLNLIVERVEDLGFNINYEGLNRERQLQVGYFEQDYDLTSFGYTGRPHRLDPHMLLYKNYHSSQTQDGNYNWTNHQRQETDELLDEQARTLDQDERQKIIKEVQALLMEEPAGEMPIEHDSLINVTNTEDFEGFVKVAGIGLKNIWTWTNVEPTSDRTQLTASIDLEIPWITPLWSNEANLITQRMVHDKLARIDEDGLPTPWLAEDWTVSEDNTTITVPLQEDFTFHDGESLTAEDVKFTFDYLAEYEVPFFADAVDPIESVEQTGDYEVVVNLEEPFAPIFTLTFARVHIIPKHVWENIPEEADTDEPWQWSPTDSEYGLVGSGPFEFSEWRKGEGIRVEANDDHPIATPNISSMFLREIQTPGAVTAALENKEVDFMIRSSGQASVLENLADENDHLTFTETASVGYDEWSMNTARSPMDRASVRGAMSAMIPKETIVREIWDGYATPAHSPTSPVLEFWHNEDVKKWPDVTREEAIQMLEDDGFTVEDGTIYYPPNVTPTEDDPDD